jgi:hypothetical protein
MKVLPWRNTKAGKATDIKGRLRTMKKLSMSCLLSMIASAQVLVNQTVTVNADTGMKIVTVSLTVKGDKPYSGDHAGAPELGILCQQASLGKQHKSKVALTLATGSATEPGFPIQDSGLSQSLGIILTLIRFDEEIQPRQLAWEQTAEYPGLLIREDFKFIRDHVLNSKLVHIDIAGSGAGANVSSFSLSGVKQEFAKHRECKQ